MRSEEGSWAREIHAPAVTVTVVITVLTFLITCHPAYSAYVFTDLILAKILVRIFLM